MRDVDDGGYAKPMGSGSGAGEHFGTSHAAAADFGGDFSKVDFDKPLFDFKSKDGGD